jgi:hypothetical protein
MSWDGFLFFCHDFNITPRRDGKGDRKMNTRAGEAFLFPDNMDAKIVFTMTALAPSSLLKVRNAGDVEWADETKVIWRDATR